MDLDLLKLLGQGGITAFALGLVAILLWRIGNRMIEAIDRVGKQLETHSQKLEDHTKSDTAAHMLLREETVKMGADLRRDIAVLTSRVDAAIDWSERTPVGTTIVEASPPYRALRDPPSERTRLRTARHERERDDERSETEYSFRRRGE